MGTTLVATLRRYGGHADLPAMAGLRNARVERDGEGEYTTVESMVENYDHLQRCDPAADIVVAEVDGRVVGYARTQWDDMIEGFRGHWLIVEADPSVGGLEGQLVEWGERRAAAVAAGDADPVADRRLLAEAAVGGERQRELLGRGYVPLRFDAMMVRPHLADIPDRPLPDGAELRPVERSHLRAIWDADVDSFRDHHGYVEPTEVDWEQFVDSVSQTGTDLWQIAWAGDTVVGQVRTFAQPEEIARLGRRRAWTESISTHRAWRGRGVASAVICASLRQLADVGYDEAALGVDTRNPTGAFGLYEGLGYGVVMEQITYQRAL